MEDVVREWISEMFKDIHYVLEMKQMEKKVEEREAKKVELLEWLQFFRASQRT